MVVQITPINSEYNDEEMEEEEEEEEPSSSHVSVIEKGTFLTSIKFLLMLMISLLILICVVTLSVIWISSFSSEVTAISSTVRQEEFYKIVSFIERTLREVLLVVESAKSQLYYDFEYDNAPMVERHLFKLYKVCMKYLESVFLTLYVGDPAGSSYGVLNSDGMTLFYNMTPGMDQYFYECRNVSTTEYCDRTEEPYETAPEFVGSFIEDTAAEDPGNPIFTISYADSTLPEYVFLTTVSSWNGTTVNEGEKYSYYFAIDMTVATVSNYLLEITQSITGSVAFVIEKKTDFLIASHDPKAVMATWDENDVIYRKTAHNFGGPVTEIGKVVYDTFKSFDEITCKSEKLITLADKYVTVYRLCSDEGIDWILVFSVPQWNYIGSMIIAIICSLFGSIIIVTFSIVMAIVFSLKIVKPFHNLIKAFESVSNMELDNLKLSKTKFTEVRHLQIHFNSMIARIKLYRRFIPPHLLSQLDSDGDNVEAPKLEESSKMKESKHETSMRSKSDSESKGEVTQSGKLSNSKDPSSRYSSRKVQPTNANLFSLYLDKRKVTFVTTHMEGLNNWLINLNPNECVHILSDIFEIVGQVAKTNSGQIGKFESESLSVHFNASGDQLKHELKGVQLCHQILTKLTTYKDGKLSRNEAFKKFDASLLTNFKFRIAAACQYNLCGNLGTKQVMNFSILGSSNYNIECMIDTAKQLDIAIVISDELNGKLDNQFLSRYIDSREMLAEDHYTSPILSEHDQCLIPRKIYELGESNAVAEDEWMYELEAKEKKNRWKKYHQAVELYFDEKYRQSYDLFEEYIADLPNFKIKEDRAALKHLELCSKHLQ